MHISDTQSTVLMHQLHNQEFKDTGYPAYLHYQLMSSWNQRKAISMVKGFWNILSKRITCTSRRNAPATTIIWIWP